MCTINEPLGENEESIKHWRIGLFFMGYFVCLLVGGIISVLPQIIIGFEQETGYSFFAREIARIPITLGLLLVYTKYLLKMDLHKKILHFKGFDPLTWGIIGVLLPIATIGLFFITGNLEISTLTTVTTSKERIVGRLLQYFGMALTAGILEEVVFRGYMMHLLREKYATWVVVTLPGILFMAMHLGAADSWFNCFQLLVAGVLVSVMFFVIYKKTGSIWNASLVHFIWDLFFFILNKNYYISFTFGSSAWFNGGAFGPSASIPALMVYSAVVGSVLYYSQRSDKIIEVVETR